MLKTERRIKRQRAKIIKDEEQVDLAEEADGDYEY